jgi:hypothetical protein
MNYLKTSGMKLGLLINFGHHPLIKSIRIVSDDRWNLPLSEFPDLRA